MSHIYSFALSEKGLRDSNDDAFCAERLGGFQVFAVAGGKMGRPGGVQASTIAINSLRDAVRGSPSDPVAALEKAVLDADAKIGSLGVKNADLAGMGTDLCACLADADLDCTILDTGTGGVYYVSRDSGIVIPRDIPFAERGSGAPKKAGEKKTPPVMISHTLGEPMVIRGSEFSRVNLRNSFIILSSWGFHDYVKKEVIQEVVLRNGENVDVSCEELKNKAMLAGSDRTITLVIIHGHPD
jgi:serine/threonine protein phosphatase PrpC